MPLPIEDYALIGDCHTAALVGRDGSIDWLCLPRFDSAACFAALVGSPENGRWLIAPEGDVRASRRRYRSGTLILETEFETGTGAVKVIDCMPVSTQRWDIVRLVEGLRGCVKMRMELIIRLDYGSIVPWVRHTDGVLLATAGPGTIELRTPVQTHGEHMATLAEFEVNANERVSFDLNYRPSWHRSEPAIDTEEAVKATENYWREWSGRCTDAGPWTEAVQRSLITLKALTYSPTGGIVAAATTS
ncbi:MAG: glycoside hydrolase family 15 protein, partial [Gammaproteobacteria bacterium]